MRPLSLAALFVRIGVAHAAPRICAQATAATLPPVLLKHKVVFQVSDNNPKKWELTISNLRDIQSDLGKENVAVEVGACAPGLAMLQLESFAGTCVAVVLQAGVKVVACDNTILGQKLTKDEMLPGISHVPTGVSEIKRLQEAGYAYVRS